MRPLVKYLLTNSAVERQATRLYGMQQELANSSQSDGETALTAELLDDLEKINRSAHEALQYTPIPLSQLAALQ